MDPGLKYNKMLHHSLRSNNSILSADDDPFQRTTIRKQSNDGQLW
jgi:hypothetical protein